MKETKKLRVKLAFLHIFSFITCILPVAIVVFLNREKWFSTPQESVKIGIGAVIGIVLICLKVLAKIKMPRRIVVYGIVFAMTYLLGSILADLLLLSGMAFLGEALDCLFFQTAIKRTKEKITAEQTAEATAAQVEKIVEKYVGSGRT